MRLTSRVMVVLAISTVIVAPLRAESEARFKLFGGAVWSTPIDDSRARLAGETKQIELGSDLGWEAGIEWRITPLIGLEAALSRTAHEVEFGGSPLGEVELEPLYLSLNLHLVRRHGWDWWVAPTIAFYEWRDAGFRRGVQIDQDRETGIGATVGFDRELGDHWSATAALRYVDMQVRFGGGGEAAVDPLSLRAGVGFRF